MAVKVRRERPDQRRHHRVTAPLFVEVGGHRVRAADWSLGGLRVEGFPGPLPAIGKEIAINLTLPFQGFDVSFPVMGEVLRLDPETSMFAVEFTEIGERERELMQHFIEELIRGAMSSAEDTIQRIDVPVTPASLRPDGQPSTPAIQQVAPARLPAKRWPSKTIAMSAFYIVLGLFIFSYAGVLVYSNVFRMEVRTAVISAPVETVEAQVDGRLAWTGLKPGDEVRAGEVIVKLVDAELEREIELADIAIREKKARLVHLKRRHADELDRIKGFAALEMKNVEQAKLDLEETQAQLLAAVRQYERIEKLHTKGFATDARLDEAEQQKITLEKTLARRRLEVTTRAEIAGDNIGKRFYSGDDLIGNSEELDADVRLAEHEIGLARQRYEANVSLREARAVRAPFTGRVAQLPRLDAGSVRRGDVVAIVEKPDEREVIAYLTQDEVGHVGLHDEVLLHVPALGESVQGRVTGIDRTTGFLREQDMRANPGYSWRGPTDRSAQVTIAFLSRTAVADANRFRPGLPVIVAFTRRPKTPLLSALQGLGRSAPAPSSL
ncbi:MAG: HlyD family efflux transporter periplasmic adaptor subunit [Hyphomicrobiaceae bacterium]|nr:HlyD family efflux transporter periplasmic adaptor subunit [Hyphomicrobiaceae bacterium]